MYLVKAITSSILAQSDEKKCNRACAYNYDPVCASNGKDYSNDCVFNYENCKSGGRWTIRYKGLCNSKCVVQILKRE